MITIRFGLGGFCCLALLLSAGCKSSPNVPAATAYDLRIDTAFNTMPVASRHLLIVITPAPGTTTPAPAGSQITVQGSMTMSSGGSFNYPWTTVGPGWTCSGPGWTAFQCTITLSTPLLDHEGVQLFTNYLPQPPNTTVTYIASVSMAGNTDPDPTNDSRNVTHGLN